MPHTYWKHPVVVLCIAPTAGTQICTTAPMTAVAGSSVKGSEGAENRKLEWEMSQTRICRSVTPGPKHLALQMGAQHERQGWTPGQQSTAGPAWGDLGNRKLKWKRGFWLAAAPGSVAFPVIVQYTTVSVFHKCATTTWIYRTMHDTIRGSHNEQPSSP